MKLFYALQTWANCEVTVQTALEARREMMGDALGEIFLPTQTIVVNGAVKTVAKYGGYLLVELRMDGNVWTTIRRTPKVLGFLGGANPVPLTAEEVARMKGETIASAAEPTRVTPTFSNGTAVRVLGDSAWNGFTGTVTGSKDNRVLVELSVLGRPMSLEVSPLELEAA